MICVYDKDRMWALRINKADKSSLQINPAILTVIPGKKDIFSRLRVKYEELTVHQFEKVDIEQINSLNQK